LTGFTPSPSAHSPGFRKLLALNRAHWDELSALHLRLPFYDVEAVRRGSLSITDIEREELGPVAGLRGVHLQCGIGLETISLARLGARMVGVDFSSRAVAIAASIARECNESAQFAVGDVMDAATLPAKRFDFIYTSHGVLRWLPSIELWATALRRLVKRNGFLYMFEIHPLVFRLAATGLKRAVLRGDYFAEVPTVKKVRATHAAQMRKVKNDVLVHTDWTISSVLNALIESGFRIDFFNEHRGCSYSRKGLLPRELGRLWFPTSSQFPIPLSFSLKATRVS